MNPSDTPPPLEQSPASPIADLSYRSYDGPLYTRAIRWWVIALAGIRMSFKQKGLWALISISGLAYLFAGIILYVQSQFHPPMGGPAGANSFGPWPSDPAHKYASAFYGVFGWQSFWLLLIALMIGTRSIASDNRANALLVYLSKPITRSDYLLGKWVSMFAVVFIAAMLPMMVLYVYCVLSFTSDGFFRQDPYLILRLIGVAAVPAAIHASLLLGFSAWSKTPRMAGSMYAAFYFASWIIVSGLWNISSHGMPDKSVIAGHLSLPGVIGGLVQNIYGITPQFMGWHRHMGVMLLKFPLPDFCIMLLAAGSLMAAGIFAAFLKVRAVEVIRG
jgi:ABC-2 type transport system permease protein